MAASKSLADSNRGHSGNHFGLRDLGRGIFQQGVDIVARLGSEIIRREAACAALALVFCSTVVAPAILIFWDRSLPFEYVDATMVEQAGYPGQRVHFRVTVRKVGKTCGGHVDRIFIDAAGKVYPMPGQRTAYQYFPDKTDGAKPVRMVERSWEIPVEAAAGEGSYVTFPTFWCQPLQEFYPIHAPAQRARITVLSRPVVVDR